MVIALLTFSFDMLEKAAFLSEKHASYKALKWLLLSMSLIVLSAVPLLVELSLALRVSSDIDLVLSACNRVRELLDFEHAGFVFLQFRIRLLLKSWIFFLAWFKHKNYKFHSCSAGETPLE